MTTKKDQARIDELRKTGGDKMKMFLRTMSIDTDAAAEHFQASFDAHMEAVLIEKGITSGK